ncbi:MAG: aminopeptidase P N-terminal domain-containing protein [Proteobacteria bacterium]|nr:aminopeptidase P N-terminal domain-containing protein [Pseudomonadota bacterium]
MITAKEFKKRRKQISKVIGNDSIAIVKARDVYLRNGDADYKYRPDSSFFYLTGCHEPDSLVIICPDGDQGEDILFCRKVDPKNVIWNGPMLGLDDAKEKLLFDNSFDIDLLNVIIPQLMLGRDKVYFMLGADSGFDKQIVEWTNAVKKEKWASSKAPHELVSLKATIDDMRVYKSKDEIKCMQKSADIAALAHMEMMKACRPGLFEYHLNAVFLHSITNHNSQASYLPIVGGGENACILHYVNNNHELIDGDLVLIDAGAECDYYASDVTRTFPVNGQYSKAQKEIYDVVLKAHTAALSKVKPGNHWNEPHDAAVEAITQGLIDLGLLKGDLQSNLEEHNYTQFYMHKTGHWIGLDVHDCGEYSVDGLWVELEPNMVLTIEPGIYVNADANVAKKYRGIGIRIEDDVLITKDGYKILSDKVPRTTEEIEELMRKSV